MITILHFVDYSMSIPQQAVVFKGHVKFEKLVDITNVNLYHVKCAISEHEETN